METLRYQPHGDSGLRPQGSEEAASTPGPVHSDTAWAGGMFPTYHGVLCSHSLHKEKETSTGLLMQTVDSSSVNPVLKLPNLELLESQINSP